MKTKIVASNAVFHNLSKEESVKPSEMTVISYGKSYKWIGTQTKEYSLGQLSYWKTVGRALLKTVTTLGIALFFSQSVRDDWKVVGTFKREVAYYQENKPTGVIKTDDVASESLKKMEPAKEEAQQVREEAPQAREQQAQEKKEEPQVKGEKPLVREEQTQLNEEEPPEKEEKTSAAPEPTLTTKPLCL